LELATHLIDTVKESPLNFCLNFYWFHFHLTLLIYYGLEILLGYYTTTYNYLIP